MIERNGVFWKQWFDYGVAFISDLMNSDGKFLTLKEFQSKFEIKVNYFHYFQLNAAIPPDLKGTWFPGSWSAWRNVRVLTDRG